MFLEGQNSTHKIFCLHYRTQALICGKGKKNCCPRGTSKNSLQPEQRLGENPNLDGILDERQYYGEPTIILRDKGTERATRPRPSDTVHVQDWSLVRKAMSTPPRKPTSNKWQVTAEQCQQSGRIATACTEALVKSQHRWKSYTSESNGHFFGKPSSILNISYLHRNLKSDMQWE